MKLYSSAILILVFAVSYLHAKTPLGFLRPDAPYELNCKEIPLLSQPGGKKVGSVTIYEDLSTCLGWAKLEENKVQVVGIDWWPDGKCSALTFYELRDQHAKVLSGSLKESLWISLKQTIILDKDFDIEIYTIPWMNDLIGHSLWEVWGYHRYRLREKPTLNGDILVTLQKYNHVIKKFTGKTDGSWAEVIIYEVERIPKGCYSEGDIDQVWNGKQWKGWLKVLDDNGQPKDIKWAGLC